VELGASVAADIGKLAGAGHHADEDVIIADLHLGAAETWCAVTTHRSEDVMNVGAERSGGV
jgi:hypothetical protein